MALKSEKLFELMESFLKENGKTLIPKVKAIYRFDILDKKGVIIIIFYIFVKSSI